MFSTGMVKELPTGTQVVVITALTVGPHGRIIKNTLSLCITRVGEGDDRDLPKLSTSTLAQLGSRLFGATLNPTSHRGVLLHPSVSRGEEGTRAFGLTEFIIVNPEEETDLDEKAPHISWDMKGCAPIVVPCSSWWEPIKHLIHPREGECAYCGDAASETSDEEKEEAAAVKQETAA